MSETPLMDDTLTVGYLIEKVDERARRLRAQNQERGGSVRVSSLIAAWQNTNEDLINKIAQLEDRIRALEDRGSKAGAP